jgi:hypothetical protein
LTNIHIYNVLSTLWFLLLLEKNIPNENELKVVTLNAFLAELKVKNTAVVNTTTVEVLKVFAIKVHQQRMIKMYVITRIRLLLIGIKIK